MRIQVPDDLRNVAHPKQLMRVEELLLSIMREVRREDAIRGTFPALVFARSASLSAIADPVGMIEVSCCCCCFVGARDVGNGAGATH